MDRRELAKTFASRLKELVGDGRGGTARLLKDAGLDRSALSQFLDPEDQRLPRAETLRRLAASRGVSVDWLLGLENAREGRQEVTPSVRIEGERSADGSSPLERWQAEAAGQKLRYVPSTLPDMLTLTEGKGAGGVETAEARGGGAEGVLEGVALADMDVEIAMPLQRLEGLADGSGLWRRVNPSLRRRQLEHMAAACERGYPALRLHLYDEASTYAAPFTVFGKQRAAVYLGDAYLTVTAPDQVRAFVRLFDNLVRRAVVGADKVHATLGELAARAR